MNGASDNPGRLTLHGGTDWPATPVGMSMDEIALCGASCLPQWDEFAHTHAYACRLCEVDGAIAEREAAGTMSV